jgi:hypothetical protein
MASRKAAMMFVTSRQRSAFLRNDPPFQPQALDEFWQVWLSQGIIA